jgi:hypothetical protein
MRHALILSGIMLVAAGALVACKPEQTASQTGTGNSNSFAILTVPKGSSIDITLGTALTSETANIGNLWSGTTRTASVLDGHNVIPAGSSVRGTITGVTAARQGDRAMLNLGLTSFTVGDRDYAVHGTMESVVAGSPRARNLGAIGGATVAGAVIGHQVDGSSTGTVVGGLIGAGVATGVVSQTKGYQVVLKQGTPLTFTTSEAIAVRI